jgi:hypothetical protein
MRANRYLHIAVIGATLLFLVLCQTAAAGPPKKPGNPGLPGCLAKVSELNDIVANRQETIDQQEARIEELEAMLENFAPVPKTGQTSCWDENGNPIDCEGTGQDGELQKGLQWPDPRFTDNGDGTVTDNLTGLIWLKNANCFGWIDWNDALEASNNLAAGQCGLNDGSGSGDWRLPNISELHSLIDHDNYDPALPSSHPFISVHESYYWSSTTSAGADDPPYHNREYVRVELMYMGIETLLHKHLTSPGGHGWPVRGGN